MFAGLGPLVNFNFLFICGIPGGIDYFMLTLVKVCCCVSSMILFFRLYHENIILYISRQSYIYIYIYETMFNGYFFFFFFFYFIQEGKMKALDEKRINTTLNVWCRCKQKIQNIYYFPFFC